jgi:hypothetical protein
MNKTCKACGLGFLDKKKRKTFCSYQCSVDWVRNNGPTEEWREKVSNKLKQRYKESGPRTYGAAHSEKVGRATKGKYKKTPTSLYDVSTRTVTKILKRLGVGCSQCGWNDCVCDIHHINGRKIENPNSHENLTYLCPNCHRKAHAGIITKDKLISLTLYIGDKWLDYYFG